MNGNHNHNHHHQMLNGNAHHHESNELNHHTSDMSSRSFPANVGILAMEVYFPVQYVDQNKLEQFDNVSTGKYTIGLGQSKMAFCLDNEDINSICLTALNNLMEKYSIKPEEIGRLDVGTETIIDKSKSVKSTLMRLFEASGNTDVEGLDNLNACFGGTAAMFNAINWIESSYWDGRYAAVVMGDLALYAKGNARPTGGAGAIAFLIGPNASLVFERGMRSLHIAHAYDFYKPVMDSEYPIVDGKLSVSCYLNALDKCYQGYKVKHARKQAHKSKSKDFNNNHINKKMNHHGSEANNGTSNHQNESTVDTNSASFGLNAAHAFLFHSPYCKLVQKSFGRLLWNDYLNLTTNESPSTDASSESMRKSLSSLEKFKQLSNEETLSDKQLEKELVQVSESLFKTKCESSLLFAKEIGNMYTPSLYSCLASYLISCNSADNLVNKRICLFSYGSGLASAMFSLIVADNAAETSDRFSLNSILDNLKATKRRLVESRVEIDPVHYDAYLQKRELNHKKPSRQCFTNADTLYPGTWYLKSVDEMYRRVYDRVDSSKPFSLNRARESLDEQLASS